LAKISKRSGGGKYEDGRKSLVHPKERKGSNGLRKNQGSLRSRRKEARLKRIKTEISAEEKNIAQPTEKESFKIALKRIHGLENSTPEANKRLCKRKEVGMEKKNKVGRGGKSDGVRKKR